ncbi:hypothetical protein TREMEDRAFT_65037 [Tremella mesenterica DSM 1558]|uniref:uncharacterized protein n=1 Tax=Tremella mesenterica (strain ATCC 24925 / CBS 8224 / DSM 1558 / NBRC 9311 / NRRL Y-6157 / RJB 2259-6 / UBC 559-6) TaxID=578456 RepID=UPI00032D0140|nr:uncharacterized protein TREMEDRAFT_65037 [Tremella mesenterica DSM 1558]EIW66654.1 hypothetical protein TREMEDRAFT_65037 [Tremella mesenterica DSM 1558]
MSHSEPLSEPSGTFVSISDAGGSSRSKRTKTGCLTCRLRKKRCDEGKPVCACCTRLGLECMGYEEKRPRWMNQRDVVTRTAAELTDTINQVKRGKRRSMWCERASESIKSSQDTVPSSSSPVGSPPTGRHPPGQVNIPSAPECGVHTTSTSINLESNPLSSIPPIHPNKSTEHTSVYMPIPTLSPSNPLSDLDLDPEFLSLLGFSPSYPLQYPPFPGTLMFPFMNNPAVKDLSDDTPTPRPTPDIRYFHHYLEVVMPLQYKFDIQSISSLVTPLAFTHPAVFSSLCAIAALHMSAHRRIKAISNNPQIDNRREDLSRPYLTSRVSTRLRPEIPTRMKEATTDDEDLKFARQAINSTIEELRVTPSAEMTSDKAVVAAITASSFYLFDGGNKKGWRETAGHVRRCWYGLLTTAKLRGQMSGCSTLDVGYLSERLGHLINAVIWTDILVSVTDGKSTESLEAYRTLLLDDHMGDDKTSRMLRESVMGCDSTTRERHLFSSEDALTVERRCVSDVFYHGVRVFLAVVVNGSFPAVPEIASAVQDTLTSLLILDSLPQTTADRALIFPIVMAGCHTSDPSLQDVFRNRFRRLGDEGSVFGNTATATRLMEEVWVRRGRVERGKEVGWREVMFDLYDEGMLLI